MVNDTYVVIEKVPTIIILLCYPQFALRQTRTLPTFCCDEHYSLPTMVVAGNKVNV